MKVGYNYNDFSFNYSVFYVGSFYLKIAKKKLFYTNSYFQDIKF